VTRKAAIALSLEQTGFAPVLFGGEVERGVRFVAGLGLPAVELSIRDPDAVNRSWLKGVLAENGLSLTGIATGQAYYNDGLSLTAPDEARRTAAFARLKRQVELASELGAAVIVGGIRGALPDDPVEQARLEETFYAGLQDLADYARSHGVSLALEPINRYETNLINTVGEGLEALARVGRKNFGLLLDTFHMNIEEPGLGDSIRTAGQAAVYVHVADSNRWAPGKGHLPFGEVWEALDAIGYQGPVSAEILPRPTSEEAARTAAGFLKGAIGS
jgi:sugar phosphate isomerase/epimerase